MAAIYKCSSNGKQILYWCFATALIITNITAVNYVPILKVKDYQPVQALKIYFLQFYLM